MLRYTPDVSYENGKAIPLMVEDPSGEYIRWIKPKIYEYMVTYTGKVGSVTKSGVTYLTCLMEYPKRADIEAWIDGIQKSKGMLNVIILNMQRLN